MAGRPSLRPGEHGAVARRELSKGTWVARCRFRDSDNVTRIVERQSPEPGRDQWGRKAEIELLDSLKNRQPPNAAGEVTGATKVIDLVTAHIRRLEEDGKAESTLETYRSNAAQLGKLIGALRVSEATPPRIDAALRSMKNAHGAGRAKHSKALLRGALHLAVMAGALPSNPAKDVSPIRSAAAKGARALSVEQFAALLQDLYTSERCERFDLADPITMLMATGLRRSELLGLRWTDYDAKEQTIAVTGKVVRVKGKGLQRYAATKSKAGRRTLPLPQFAIDMLTLRRKKDYVGEQTMLFPSTAGTYRDPNNFGRDWRLARDELKLPDVTSHSFRKTVATMIDDAGLSARIGADHLGHAKVSMTQDRYMKRGKIHLEVADLLDRAFREIP